MGWQEIIQREIYDPLEAQFPNRPGNLAEVFMHASSAFATRTAVEFEGQQITYRSFGELTVRAAHSLRDRFGIEAGDRVAVLLGSEPAFGIAVWAAVTIGAVVCPMNVRHQASELRHQLAHAEPKAIVADGALVERIIPFREEIPGLQHLFTTHTSPPPGVLPLSTLTAGPRPAEVPFRFVQETAPAFIFYTAGTTGHPKGVVTSHRAMTYSILRAQASDPVEGSSEVVCIPVPLHYTGGCKSFLSTMARGGKCILLKQWRIDDLLKVVHEHRVTNLFALGSIWSLLVSSPRLHDYDLSSIRSVLFGGSATPPSVIQRVRSALPRAKIIQGYGMTECNSGTVEEDAVARPESSGLPSPTTQLRIVDDEDQELPACSTGQVLIRNSQIFSGYWKDPEATEEAMRGGWYHTGDLGYLDNDGRLHIVGRLKDMIIRGQENIYPAEVEAVITRHPDVREVAVVGVPDEIFGEQVKAFVVTERPEPALVDQVLGLCREHLAEYKVPSIVELRDQPLPRNAGGKVIKRDLL